MATLEKNVLMVKKEGQNIIIEYPATRRDCIVDFPESLQNPNSMILKIGGGITEGVDQFTYDGSTEKIIDIPLYYTDSEVDDNGY